MKNHRYTAHGAQIRNALAAFWSKVARNVQCLFKFAPAGFNMVTSGAA